MLGLAIASHWRVGERYCRYGTKQSYIAMRVFVEHKTHCFNPNFTTLLLLLPFISPEPHATLPRNRKTNNALPHRRSGVSHRQRPDPDSTELQTSRNQRNPRSHLRQRLRKSRPNAPLQRSAPTFPPNKPLS